MRWGKAVPAALTSHSGVRPGWVWKVAAAHHRGGRMERVEQRRRPMRRVDGRALNELLVEEPDLFLRELGWRYVTRIWIPNQDHGPSGEWS